MSQDMDDEEDWELEDDDDEDQIINEDPTRQLDVDICPPTLDQKLYDDVVALREKRLDLGTDRPPSSSCIVRVSSSQIKASPTRKPSCNLCSKLSDKRKSMRTKSTPS